MEERFTLRDEYVVGNDKPYRSDIVIFFDIRYTLGGIFVYSVIQYIWAYGTFGDQREFLSSIFNCQYLSREENVICY